MTDIEETPYQKLRKIDVGEHIEKKGNLSYLSWAYALDTLYQHDPHAHYHFLDDTRYDDGTVMVHCELTACGMGRYMWLPVLDYKNNPIKNPNAFAINTARMRCLTKAIATLGIGLYIYAGEDLPPGEDNTDHIDWKKVEYEMVNHINGESNPEMLTTYMLAMAESIEDMPAHFRANVDYAYNARKMAIQHVDNLEPWSYKFPDREAGRAWMKEARQQIDAIDTIPDLDAWENLNMRKVHALQTLLVAKTDIVDDLIPYDRIKNFLKNKRKDIEDNGQ